MRNLRLRFQSGKFGLRNLHLRCMLPKKWWRILLLRFVLAKNRLRNLRLPLNFFFYGPALLFMNLPPEKVQQQEECLQKHSKRNEISTLHSI